MEQTKTHKQIILDCLQSLWMLNPDDPFIEGFKLQGKELISFTFYTQLHDYATGLFHAIIRILRKERGLT